MQIIIRFDRGLIRLGLVAAKTNPTEISPFQTFQSFNRFNPFKAFREFLKLRNVAK